MKTLFMIFVLFKLQMFIKLYFWVIIAINFVHKHSKCREKILELAEFIYYLSFTSLLFFKVLPSKLNSYFIVYKILMSIIFQ